MSATEPSSRAAADLAALDRVSDAVESGDGLPAVARAAGRAMGASVIVLDSASSVLAVACASTDDERAVMAGESGSESVDLRVGGDSVGRLRYRSPDGGPAAASLRMVATLIGQEVERAKAPERASEAAVSDFLGDLLRRKLTDRDNIVARAEELGCDLGAGAAMVVVRARPHQPEEGDWRARVLTVAERGARGVERTALAALVEPGPLRVQPGGGADRELLVLIPGEGPEPGRRVAAAVERELEAALPSYAVLVALSRPAADPADLHRSAAEALLAANVAEARGLSLLAFEETGAYRLLLPAMSEDPGELARFYEETVAPLVAYDTQYDTELVHTLESFLEADGNVAKTAQRLFTHRHTIRYRLDRAQELPGLDGASTDGRERLSLGLKAMRVLGIMAPGGPAHEPGTEAGRVPNQRKPR